MPFKEQHGLHYYVPRRKLAGSKTRASTKKYRDATTASNTKSTESETSSTSPTKTMPPSTEPETSSAPPNKSNLPCVKTLELVVAVHLISRTFKDDVVQEVLRKRFRKEHDPGTFDTALSLLKNGTFYHEKGLYDLNLVDLWLNKQMLYEYEELRNLTWIDDQTKQIAQEAGQNVDDLPHLEVLPFKEGPI